MTHHPHWRFRRMTPAEINQDPVQGEFFTSTSDLAERLVRESIQNSLDAARGDGPVLVRFAFSSESEALPFDQAVRYLDGLGPHLEAVALSDVDRPSTDAANEDEDAAAYNAFDLIDKEVPLSYLVVEDLGTQGLTGDIQRNSEFERDNRFWGFFRSVGISPNVGGTGGSWGLGKWVFPDVSRINAYLGITRRSDEQRHLLMGMAILKTHHDDVDKYPPYGQYAVCSNALDAEWLPLPANSDDDPDGVLDNAIEDFKLQRRRDSGLSIVIPYPNEELRPDEVERAVVTQYFLPIVYGDLEVEIVADGDVRHIDGAYIDEAARHIARSDRDDDDESAESLVKVIELARWARDVGDDSLIDLRATTSSGILAAQDLEALRERFDRGERLGFRLSTNVTDRKTETKEPNAFRVYLEQDNDLPQGHEYFVRGHLRISQMRHIKSFHARALILVDQESKLGDLLRDAEGPAHVVWNPHADRLKKRWFNGYERVQEVRRAAPLLLGPLAEVPRERLKSLLADLFPAPAGGGGVGSDPPPPPPPRSSSAISIRDLKDGFAIRSDPKHPKAKDLPGTVWLLSFAYDVARGGQRAAFNNFREGAKRQAPDFDLFGGVLRVACGGCRYSVEGQNEVKIRILESEFHLSVRGFDDRDVIIDLHQQAPDRGTGNDDE